MKRCSSKTLPEIFTHADALALGVSNRDLYAMRDSGEIERVARGIYAHPSLQVDHNLIEIAVRAPRATMCLTSALAHHDLVDDIPTTIHMAIPRSQRAPTTTAPVTWHRFDIDSFDTGRMTLRVTDELSIGLYEPARSVVDAYRLRHLYGTEQALQALKRWLQTSGNQPSELLSLTKHFPATTTIIRSTLETLL